MKINFQEFIRSSYHALMTQTFEETRCQGGFMHQLKELKLLKAPVESLNPTDMKPRARECFTWDIAEGLRRIYLNERNALVTVPTKEPITAIESYREGGQDKERIVPTGAVVSGRDALAPLEWLKVKRIQKRMVPDQMTGQQVEQSVVEDTGNVRNNTIIFLKDYHRYLKPEFQDSGEIIRTIRNLRIQMEKVGASIVIIAPEMYIPEDLNDDIVVLDFPLPTEEDLRRTLQYVCGSARVPVPENAQEIIDAAKGLTQKAAENAFSLAIIKGSGTLDSKVVRYQKSQIAKKSKFVTLIQPNAGLEDLGGHNKLKAWLRKIRACSCPEARARGIKTSKGVILAGPPGTGKSQTMKLLANILNRDINKYEVGQAQSKWYGESENNLQKVIKICTDTAPSMLFFDEGEKTMGGQHESSTRQMGMLLNFMQDNTADVFVGFTANNLKVFTENNSALLRAGRIDAIFWVDLPGPTDRAEIFRIHLRKTGWDEHMFDDRMSEITAACKGFTGAEIEEWIQRGLTFGFLNGNGAPKVEDFLATKDEIQPYSIRNASELSESRRWAKDHGVLWSSDEEPEPIVATTPVQHTEDETGRTIDN